MNFEWLDAMEQAFPVAGVPSARGLVAALVVASLLLWTSCLATPQAPLPPPPPGRLLEVAPGLRTNVFDEGEGPPVVLVHGCPASAYDWSPLNEELVRNGFRVIRYDRVGYGHSDRRVRDRDHTYTANARELVGLLDVLAIDSATLVGWSYGGGVVQVAAQTAPGRVTGLVLVGSVGPRHERGMWSFLESILFATEPINNWALRNGYGRGNVRRTLQTAFNGPVPEGWVERTLSLLALPGAGHTWISELKFVEPGSLKPERLALPVVILHGDSDQVSDYETAIDLQRRITGSRLITVEEGSHMLAFTHPTLVLEAISELSAPKRPL